MIETEADGDLGWSYFKRQVQRLTGVDLNAYKEPQMRRRLGQMMSRRGATGWAIYARRLKEDEAALAEFRDFFTINVSEFFRQPERYEELRTTHLPALLEARPTLKVWSAGCSIGAEPYSLAILLAELSPRGRHRIIATDIDETALARARDGRGYLDSDVRSVPAALRDRYLRREAGGWAVDDSVRKAVEFSQHDLLSDPYPNDIDLIVCRNVVIYFTEEAKTDIYRRFHRALRPGGLLFVGGTEIVAGARATGFSSPSMSFYRKAA